MARQLTSEPKVVPRVQVAAAWWVPVSALSPMQLSWRQMPIGELLTQLRSRPQLSRLLGIETVGVASITLPPPVARDGASSVRASLGHTSLWGLTLAFCSDMLARAGRPGLVGEVAARAAYRRPYQASSFAANACLGLLLQARKWPSKAPLSTNARLALALSGSSVALLIALGLKAACAASRRLGLVRSNDAAAPEPKL